MKPNIKPWIVSGGVGLRSLTQPTTNVGLHQENSRAIITDFQGLTLCKLSYNFVIIITYF